MNDAKQLYSFSQPVSFKLLANHGEKIFYFLVFVAVLFTYQDLHGQFLIRVMFLIILLFICLVFFGKLVSKVLWRFDVDFAENKIIFYPCRKVSPIHVDFTEINKIKVSGPIVFFIGNRKYYYSSNQYEQILKTLKIVKKITWGDMCDILGPTKSIREIIDGE